MSSEVLLATGDTFSKRWTFYIEQDGVKSPEDLSGATNIYAAVIAADKTTVLIASTAQTNSGSADWANGKVAIKFTTTQTATITSANYGLGYIEVVVVTGGEYLPYKKIPITIEKGNIHA